MLGLLLGALLLGAAATRIAAPATSAATHSAATAASDRRTATPATSAAADQTSALVVFAPVGEREIARLPGMAVGLMSASQGVYSQPQLLLDFAQGARIAASAYPRPVPPPLSVSAYGSGAVIAGWTAARRRAEDAPQLLDPGLLAAQVLGGAGYAGTSNRDHLDALLAADRSGRIAAFSTGPAASLLARVAALRARKRLVVADLPGGPIGRSDLLALTRARTLGELLVVVQRRRSSASAGRLLWTGLAGVTRELTSRSTNERGLVVSIDLAPTILRALGLAVPAAMRGTQMRADGRLDGAGLRALKARLYVIGPRRLPALGWLVAALAIVLLCAAPWPRARAWALRTCGLAVLWTPVATLMMAGLALGAAYEYAAIAFACLTLGALTDLLAPWPRAPLAPAIVALALLTADALAGTQLQMRSLLGPDPLLGARFYGIGNELKSGLAVLVFAAVAAWCYPSSDSGSARRECRGADTTDGARTDGTSTNDAGIDGTNDADHLVDTRRSKAAMAMAGAGILLAVVEGAARIGAGVGGVVLVSAGAAVAVVMLLPGALTRRRALTVLIAPVAGLALLAALDLATAHGSGHFIGSVLDVRSSADLHDLIVRRYTAAWDELRTGAMPVATALALLATALGIVWRERLLAPVTGDPAWLAAFGGGLTAGLVGALVEDSGPVLLVVAVFTLACISGYLWGKPAPAQLDAPALSPQPTSRKGFSARTEPIC